MSIISIARPEIQALVPYSAAEQVDATVRLNANEAPLPISGDRFRRPLNRYPEVRPNRLGTALATHFGVAPQNTLVTRGSSEAIDLLIRAFCRAGIDNIVTTAPSFSMYRHYAVVQGATVREVATNPDNDFAIAANDILEACDSNTRLVFLCSPNNPTGNLLERDVLIKILEARNSKSAIVVDEAYIEFSGSSGSTDLLGQYPNLIVLRTLSKALAFAGARCGAALGPPEVIRMLSAVQAPYAIATPVSECVEDALQESGIQEAASRIADIVSERERMSAALQSFWFVERLWPSAANFLFLQLRQAPHVLEQVRNDKILLRDFGGDLDDCVRITIGSQAENDQLLTSLERVSR